MMSLIVDLKSFVASDAEFQELCRANPDLRIERTHTGEVIIMSPACEKTGERNNELSGQLWLWNRQVRLGHVFDSSTGFKLPNSAIRAPDASWVRADRWQALSEEAQSKFPPICPDFVIELRSPTDSETELRAKMEEYLANGAQLGWLIDPKNRQAAIYRRGESTQMLDKPQTVSGDPVLPGFILDLTEIFTEVGADG